MEEIQSKIIDILSRKDRNEYGYGIQASIKCSNEIIRLCKDKYSVYDDYFEEVAIKKEKEESKEKDDSEIREYIKELESKAKSLESKNAILLNERDKAYNELIIVREQKVSNGTVSEVMSEKIRTINELEDIANCTFEALQVSGVYFTGKQFILNKIVNYRQSKPIINEG